MLQVTTCSMMLIVLTGPKPRLYTLNRVAQPPLDEQYALSVHVEPGYVEPVLHAGKVTLRGFVDVLNVARIVTCAPGLQPCSLKAWPP